MTQQHQPRAASAGQAMILTTVLLWGAQVPVLHALGPRWDVFTLNLLRYAVALAVLALLLRLLERTRLGAPPSPSMARALALGGLMAGFGFLYTASAMLGDPVATAAVAAAMPLTASCVTWAMLGTAPSRRHLLALTVVVPAGALVIPAGLPADASAGGHPGIGVALMIAAQATWALYSLLAQSWAPGVSDLHRTALSVAGSLPWTAAAFALAWVTERTIPPVWPPPVLDAAFVAFVTLGPLVTGVVFWNGAVARLGLPATALYLNLIPVVGIAGAALLGVWPDIVQLVGAAAMIGAMIAFRPPRTAARD